MGRRKAHTEKTVGPWAKKKLDALERYLKAYMLVMQKQRFKLFYIDAFAGAGLVRVRGASTAVAPEGGSLIPDSFEAEDQEQLEEFISGSPLRALNLDKMFHHYRFIELDPKRVADLKALADGRSGCDIKVLEGEANERVQFIASHFKERSWRGVAFLDPYGAHLHWASLEALARTGKFDVIINFPMGMTINRLVKTDILSIPETWATQLDLCFGCRDWRDIAFSTERDFFGESVVKRADAGQRLLNLYINRLEAIFGNVSLPSLVRNTKGAPLYYLLWAGSNPKGKGIANHILGLGEKVLIDRVSRAAP
jgi:three-Cys-motif partner protein